MQHRAHYVPWVLVAGAIAGFFQVVPLNGGMQCCCTPWFLFGGLAAVIVVGERARASVEPGEAAFIGLLAGLVGGVVGGGLAAMRSLLWDSTSFAADVLLGREEMIGLGLARNVFFAVVTFMVYALVFAPPLSVIGGLIGVFVTRRRDEGRAAAAQHPAPPQPPAPIPATRPPPTPT